MTFSLTPYVKGTDKSLQAKALLKRDKLNAALSEMANS